MPPLPSDDSSSESESDVGSLPQEVDDNALVLEDNSTDESQLIALIEEEEDEPQTSSEPSYSLEEQKALEIVSVDDTESLEDKILFFKERECLLLLLEARRVLSSMITRKEKQTQKKWEEKLDQERMRKKQTGRMTIQEVQEMLQRTPEEDDIDISSDIQELKRQLVASVRQNHKLDIDVSALDKKIALLIKNRTSIQEVYAASKGLKSQKKAEALQLDPKKLEAYQALFYLLQTDPKYLARCVYMVNPQQLESFLHTVILTLFGDSFSPREEFLILRLLQLSIEREVSAIKSLGDFISGKAETIVPKMMSSYNRRQQGTDYLKKMLPPVVKKTLELEQILEMNPKSVYVAMINQDELSSGVKSTLDRNANEDEAAQHPRVQELLKSRFEKIEEICQMAINTIIKSIDQLPYGLRYLCKCLREICLKMFPGTPEKEISRVISYFISTRFINTALVMPENLKIVNDEVQPQKRKNLFMIAKVLQQVFTMRPFTEGDKFLKYLNDFVGRCEPVILEYISNVISVSEPEDHLQVNRYLEMAQKSKPIILISLNEIVQTHQILFDNLNSVAPEKDDPLRQIMVELGEPNKDEFSEEDLERELQLTLTNRFKVDVEEEKDSVRIYNETKELIIPILRLVPINESIHRLNVIDVLEAGIKYATETKNQTLSEQINRILENLGKLERDGKISKSDNYESFLRDIALEVANRKVIREQQRREVARLTNTLEGLNKHAKYLDEQIKQYQAYLEDCKKKQYAVALAKKKKKKGDPAMMIGPFKFTYKELAKKGVIVDSEVPALSRKKTVFLISSETAGVFDVVAKVAGISVEKMQLDLDELLEKHHNNIHTLELDQVTLDVNMTIHLLNKFFLK